MPERALHTMEVMMNRQPVPPSPGGQVGQGLQEAARLVDELHSAISILEQRLSTVTKQLEAGPVDTKGTVPILVPLADMIRTFNDEVQKATCRIASISERIEL